MAEKSGGAFVSNGPCRTFPATTPKSECPKPPHAPSETAAVATPLRVLIAVQGELDKETAKALQAAMEKLGAHVQVSIGVQSMDAFRAEMRNCTHLLFCLERFPRFEQMLLSVVESVKKPPKVGFLCLYSAAALRRQRERISEGGVSLVVVRKLVEFERRKKSSLHKTVLARNIAACANDIAAAFLHK